ncbi:MAG: ankyrin repeat domain-containing protein [Alphaproteobacteria bacterium]|nr:MAG: ankyrin repeat domain-containing protein [Alphaproteobacteria bacterium]
MRIVLAFASLLASALPALAQIPPGAAELRIYAGLHAAAAKGDSAEIARLIAAGEKPNVQDAHGRTPLHVAAHFGHQAAAQALLKGGANPNALDAQRYDIVTIASVNNDVPMLRLALAGGCDPKAITSPYQGTALIAAAHLGHTQVVRVLIAAGAPLDHVNNLGWTALIESIVLGNGGKNHTDTLEALVKAGANVNIADRQGVTPLGLAKSRGYGEMARILEAAGAK